MFIKQQLASLAGVNTDRLISGRMAANQLSPETAKKLRHYAYALI
jgi:hypothetical protein